MLIVSFSNEKTSAFQREASKSFIMANLHSFSKILHGASVLYQTTMDLDSRLVINFVF